MLSEWIVEALKHAGISGAALAREMTKKLGRSIDRAAVQKMTINKRKIAADELMVIAEITGLPPPVGWSPTVTMVPLLSSVQAGVLAKQDIVLDVAEADPIAVAGLTPGDWFALRVDGDSMDRISPPESIILVNRKERSLVPNACYIFSDENFGTTYKRYRSNPDRIEPVSTNPVHEPLFFKDVHPIIVGRVRCTMLRM